jgi:hypothetical protein
MRYERTQFDTFDNIMDRREIFTLFHRLGQHLPAEQAAKLRAEFLQGLIPESVSCLAAAPLVVDPWVKEDKENKIAAHWQTAAEAYALFVAIVGVLGVPISEGARLLVEAVKRQYEPKGVILA